MGYTFFMGLLKMFVVFVIGLVVGYYFGYNGGWEGALQMIRIS